MSTDQNRQWPEFGCVRFRNSPFSALAKAAGNSGCMGVDGTLHASAFSAATSTAQRYLQSVLEAHNGVLPSEFVVLAKALQQQVLLHAAFVSAGQQVFQFTQSLLDDFKRTDLSDTPIGKLNLPYAAGFLHFGRQMDLAVDDEWRTEAEYVDGAWYHCGPEGVLTVQLSLSRAEARSSGLPGPYFTIDALFLSTPAHEAVEAAVSRDLSAARQAIDSQVLHEALGDWTVAGRPALHASLSLILNALFYLDAYGSDTGPIVPAAAPEVLRQQYVTAAASAKPKALREARNALLAEGFTVVRLCGGRVDDLAVESRAIASRQVVRTHWRRGHWRTQPCGPQLSAVKRVWVRPALVGGRGDAVAGHQYLASAPRMGEPDRVR